MRRPVAIFKFAQQPPNQTFPPVLPEQTTFDFCFGLIENLIHHRTVMNLTKKIQEKKSVSQDGGLTSKIPFFSVFLTGEKGGHDFSMR